MIRRRPRERKTETENALATKGPTLGAYAAKVFVGLQTSADKVFILSRRGKRYFSEALQSEVDLEPTWVHPLLKGSVHMKRWVPLDSDQVVLFPYQRGARGFELVSDKELREGSPATWAYFQKCRPTLSQRERGTFEGENWYGYVYPKNLESVSLPKLLTPSLAQRGQFSLDSTGNQFFVGSGGGGGGGYGILLHDPSMHEYVLGLLNSSLLNWFVQRITTPFHSGWFAYNKQFIEQIPIRLPDNAKERQIAERITESVRRVCDAKVKMRAGKLSDRERQSLEGEIESLEHRIDEAVFKLYGVEGLPSDETPQPANGVEPFRTSLADWADENAEHWGDELRSDDVEGFTGRRF